jgi:outer membrane protein assembly factor BamB
LSRRLFSALIVAAAFTMALVLPSISASGDWPTYHRSNLRDGNDPSAPPFSAIGQQWVSSGLDGAIYAEPLVVGNQVIVATENNSIYSLDATTGASTWAAPAHAGTPVSPIPGPGFPCGNISPLGITGTPVVDTVAGVIYAVAFVSPSNTYELVAYNLSNGTQKFAPIPIAPAGFDVHLEQQRGALALANGYVYVPFGGYIGDCGNYHGYVIGIKADGSSTTLNVFQDQAQAVCPAGATSRAAGIWGASGPAVDASGNVYVATGNGFDTTSYDCGETVFRLNATLGYVDSWAPAVWASLNGSDADLGSIGPAVVGTTGNLIFQTGKNGWGYLLNVAKLSGNANHIGAEAFAGQICNAATTQTAANDQVFGGVAYADPYIYVPCPEGIKAVKLAAGPSFSTSWSSSVSFQAGPPVVSGGLVWSIDTGGNTLYAFDPTTGAMRFSAGVGGQTHFSTPAAGQNRIFLADGTSDTIRAFGQSAGRYHPLAPSRIYDSRNGGGPLAPNGARDIQVTGQGGVPATGVAAVVMNVTVTNTTSTSYLTVFPSGFNRPVTSNLNWTAGKTIANLVEVAVGDGGQDTVYNAFGNTDVILDVAGWVSTPGGAATPDGLYNPLVPARILDTRDGTGGFNMPVGPGQTIDVQVTSKGLVPASGVEAVVFNITATNSTAPSHLTVFPTGSSPPLASNVNFLANQTVPNRVAVQIGTGGKVSIYNLSGSVHVIVDVNGWFTDATTGGTGSLFTPVAPLRILDTRNGTAVGANQSIAVQVAGKAGVPSMAAPTPPKAVVLNVTAIGPSGAGYLTAWPDALARPTTSDLNFVAGQTVPNLVIVQVGATGKIDIYNAFGSTNVAVDVMGWYG